MTRVEFLLWVEGIKGGLKRDSVAPFVIHPKKMKSIIAAIEALIKDAGMPPLESRSLEN